MAEEPTSPFRAIGVVMECMDRFALPPSPFEREKHLIEAMLNPYSPARSKGERARTTTPRRFHKDRRARLNREQLLDVLFSPDTRADISVRNGVSTDLIYRYRRMYEETGRIFGEEVDV